jgi:hypothetical protein
MAEMIENNQEQEASMVVAETMIPMKNPEVTVREEMEEDGIFLRKVLNREK